MVIRQKEISKAYSALANLARSRSVPAAVQQRALETIFLSNILTGEISRLIQLAQNEAATIGARTRAIDLLGLVILRGLSTEDTENPNFNPSGLD